MLIREKQAAFIAQIWKSAQNFLERQVLEIRTVADDISNQTVVDLPRSRIDWNVSPDAQSTSSTRLGCSSTVSVLANGMARPLRGMAKNLEQRPPQPSSRAFSGP